MNFAIKKQVSQYIAEKSILFVDFVDYIDFSAFYCILEWEKEKRKKEEQRLLLIRKLASPCRDRRPRLSIKTKI